MRWIGIACTLGIGACTGIVAEHGDEAPRGQTPRTPVLMPQDGAGGARADAGPIQGPPAVDLPDAGAASPMDAGSLSLDAGGPVRTGEGAFCAPCRRTPDCATGRCLVNQRTDESFCAVPCAGGCPSGAICEEIAGGEQLCVPAAGSCDALMPPRQDAGMPPLGADAGMGVDSGLEPDSGRALPNGCAETFEAEVIVLANEARASQGAGPLTCDPGLARAAELHSEDMCNLGYFSHQSQDGRRFTDRIDAQGVRYRTGGENIAQGQRSPEQVHNAWMNSSGHRRNILNGSFGRVGVGHVQCGGRHFWTQVFTD